ncbi:hypothetical protein BJY04DRAFT_162831 [Aspergillus karnatakaensis]|uniref:putative zinc knuckle nucleic acid binding protein n=1 Tax=Aspergillus karnatakaensis TaxID=1810916 RepID=UPI003CCE1593
MFAHPALRGSSLLARPILLRSNAYQLQSGLTRPAFAFLNHEQTRLVTKSAGEMHTRRACYKCGNLGHFADVCTSSERLCYNCKQPGHESNNCPQPRTTECKDILVPSKGRARETLMYFFSQAMLQLPGCRPRSNGLSYVARQRRKPLLQLRPAWPYCS